MKNPAHSLILRNTFLANNNCIIDYEKYELKVRRKPVKLEHNRLIEETLAEPDVMFFESFNMQTEFQDDNEFLNKIFNQYLSKLHVKHPIRIHPFKIQLTSSNIFTTYKNYEFQKNLKTPHMRKLID